MLDNTAGSTITHMACIYCHLATRSSNPTGRCMQLDDKMKMLITHMMHACVYIWDWPHLYGMVQKSWSMGQTPTNGSIFCVHTDAPAHTQGVNTRKHWTTCCVRVVGVEGCNVMSFGEAVRVLVGSHKGEQGNGWSVVYLS